MPADSTEAGTTSRSGGRSSVSKIRPAAALAFCNALFNLLAFRIESAITTSANITVKNVVCVSVCLSVTK